jgi:hypothetical protein
MAERPDEKTACRDALGRARRLGASQPEHQVEAGPIQCRDGRDISDLADRWDHQDPQEYPQASEILKSARSLRQLGAEMLVQQETGSLLAPRVVLGLQAATDVRVPGPAEHQPERQERALELREQDALQAQPKPAQRTHPGAAERWRAFPHPREKLQPPQAGERCPVRMQLRVRARLRVLLALLARPEVPRAGRGALLRRQSWRLYQPLPLLPERRGQENVCVRVRLYRGRASSSAFFSRLRRLQAGSRSGLSP